MTDFPAIKRVLEREQDLTITDYRAAWAEYEQVKRIRQMNDRLAGALNDALTNEFEWFVEAEAAVAANAALEDG